MVHSLTSQSLLSDLRQRADSTLPPHTHLTPKKACPPSLASLGNGSFDLKSESVVSFTQLILFISDCRGGAPNSGSGEFFHWLKSRRVLSYDSLFLSALMDQDTIAESFCQSYPQTTSAKYFCEPRAHASNNSLCT